MGKSTISMTIFNSFLYVYQRVKEMVVPIAASGPTNASNNQQTNRPRHTARVQLGEVLVYSPGYHY
jgi:hypothetical protein